MADEKKKKPQQQKDGGKQKKEGGKPEKSKKKGGAEENLKVPTPRLKTKYEQEIKTELKNEFAITSDFAIPRIEKVIVNMGIGNAHENKKLLETLVDHMGLITGQRAVITKARKSIANFKIRQGYNVGCKVTLRRARMYMFLEKLICVAIPRVRDFRGLGDRFDGNGNYSMGLQEQIVFPEVDAGKIEATDLHGMHITICISGGSNEQSRFLLEKLGMPFKK